MDDIDYDLAGYTTADLQSLLTKLNKIEMNSWNLSAVLQLPLFIHDSNNQRVFIKWAADRMLLLNANLEARLDSSAETQLAIPIVKIIMDILVNSIEMNSLSNDASWIQFMDEFTTVIIC